MSKWWWGMGVCLLLVSSAADARWVRVWQPERRHVARHEDGRREFIRWRLCVLSGNGSETARLRCTLRHGGW